MGALQITDLSSWGFVDKNKDGKITSDEIPTYQNTKFQTDQIKAFQLLASVAGDKTAIDQSDLDLIQSNANILSQLMQGDPEYRGDLVSRATLEEGKREVASAHVGDERDGIPPVAYRRMVSYAQLALNFQGARLSVNGIYDANMTRAVARFQSNVGLTGRDGSFIDRSTFGSLVLSSQYNPATLKDTLGSIKSWLVKQKPSAFLLDNRQASHPDHVDFILGTLQYLYPEDVPPWKTEGRLDQANACLQKHFGGPWIGAKVLQSLMDALDTRIPKK